MATTFKSLADGEAAVAVATVYTVPGATTARLSELWICNNAAATRTFSLHIVASGGSSGTDDMLINAFDVPVGTPIIFALNTYLDTGDFVRIFASGTLVAYHLSGMERT